MNGKMPYVKPGLELVDFSMTSSIAGTCRFEPLNADQETCGLLMSENGWVLYTDDAPCTIDGPLTTSDFFCYQVPTEDRTIHIS